MPTFAPYRKLSYQSYRVKAPLSSVSVTPFSLSRQLLSTSLLSCLNSHRSSVECSCEYVRWGSTSSRQSRIRESIRKDLPPLSNIYDIFDDLVKGSLRQATTSEGSAFPNVFEQLGGRKLRIATVCSGSESPLVALQLAIKSLEKQFGIKIDYEHCFSAENVKWKMKFIRDNFNPNALFCDVGELAGTTGMTDGGSMKPIPKYVDLLIAGWVCKDYSIANRKEPSAKIGGVSDTTIEAILAHAQKYRPRMVLLENVVGAPWEHVKFKWQAIGYEAAYVEVVSSDYYIPQVRKRVYMICVDQRRLPAAETAVKQWCSQMKRFKRPASSPFDAFLLQTSSTLPGLEERKPERQLQSEPDPAEIARRHLIWKPRTWSFRCGKGLHALRLVFGNRRVETGELRRYHGLPSALTDREVENYDICYQRSIKRGTNPDHTKRAWKIETCPSRYTDTISSGLIHTLLPGTKIWLTGSRRLMTAQEHLALTGFPVEHLNLTSCSSNQMKDLAGNAMTTTVIGAAILSALTTAYQVFR